MQEGHHSSEQEMLGVSPVKSMQLSCAPTLLFEMLRTLQAGLPAGKYTDQ